MPRSRKFVVEVANQQKRVLVRPRRVSSAVRKVLQGERFNSAAISVAIVDDGTIQKLNLQYLHHDYPTDVLSFAMESGGGHLEGEVVVSAETAERVAPEYGWSTEAELLLYVIHGTLHLAGYDDHTSSDRARMRQREQFFVDQIGITAPAASRGAQRPSGQVQQGAKRKGSVCD